MPGQAGDDKTPITHPIPSRSPVTHKNQAMKKIKKIVRRIRKRVSAMRNSIRARASAIRNSIRARVSAIHIFTKATASEVLHESDRVVNVVSTPQRMPCAYSDSELRYISPWSEPEFKQRSLLLFEKPWQSFEDKFQSDMTRYPSEMIVDRSSPCPLNWLPVKVRAKIWKYVFGDTKEPIFLTKDGIAPKIHASMRSVSHDWMSEAWLAWFNAMSARTLVVVDFPRHAYLRQPCPILRNLSTVRLRAIKFTLGDNDEEKAFRRNRQFLRFILKHRDCEFLAVRTLILELRKNWTAGDITEIDLADLLTCGPFAHIERIRIHGWITSERLDRFLKRAEWRAQASF
ncbi:uncharacterized protein N7479_002744 [Penicillium vulpinum]|uniref:Uncharacterized protein n=1 Tax=Penicillium vulpinum TaxID=29845 RepID=A0A1V6RTK3_9EURO|nr:uncharacterized protein N7479_002744 [Penicillium vulpinum]KAJ5972826.1 hypothetical protein N7479_002744 [Penicillium vulpinum]OQE05105.1 hypothetical protein PENVUL_c027G02540 [Penicillium vulpinum]